METYIPISFLNDFIFCPRSIYFHQLYGNMDSSLYQTTYQTEGKNAHKAIDTKKYTTSRKVLQTIEIYSQRYGIGGKIDTYDKDKKLIVERKKKIKVIYDGYIYQLYAHYHCLVEMGYEVEQMKLYSYDDNKSYDIALPTQDIKRQYDFEQLIQSIQNYKLHNDFIVNPNKCNMCIYNPMCDVSAC